MTDYNSFLPVCIEQPVIKPSAFDLLHLFFASVFARRRRVLLAFVLLHSFFLLLSGAYSFVNPEFPAFVYNCCVRVFNGEADIRFIAIASLSALCASCMTVFGYASSVLLQSFVSAFCGVLAAYAAVHIDFSEFFAFSATFLLLSLIALSSIVLSSSVFVYSRRASIGSSAVFEVKPLIKYISFFIADSLLLNSFLYLLFLIV